MPVFNDYKGVKGPRLEAVVYDTAAEVQKLKQQQTAGANIKALDLAVGEPTSLTYDVDNGISITKQGEVTTTDNSKYNITVSDEIPLLPGNNINIDASEDGKHIVISSIGGGGSGVAGVSSFGGQTGDIRVGKHLSMSGTTVNADIQPTPVIIETLDDADASSGTLTDNQLSTLQSNTANPLVKRNEYYYLNDNQHTPGALGYTHLGYENGKWYTKNITITISTKGWVRNSSDIPDKTVIPFISLSPAATSYPLNGNFSVENATKLVGSPFSVISFTPPGSPIQVPLLLQPSETIHNSYIYSGHDDSYTYTLNATLSVTTANTWLAKSYVVTREAYVAPITTTIDGVSGDIVLGANLHLENKVLTGTNTVTTVNGHTGAVNIVGGNNVTINDVGGTLTINATGGGGGGSGSNKGFDNLSALTIAASQYASPQSVAGPFYFKGSGTASWKDGSTATSIPQISVQLGCEPGDGISFRAKGEGAGASCEIGLTDLAVLDLGTFSSFPVSNQTLTDEQAELIEQHKFSFIKFRDTTGWNNALDLDVYCVPVDNAPSHGGITYKSITTQGNTYTVGISIERTSGNVFAHKTFSVTKTATPSGGALYQHNISAFAGSAIIVYCTLYTTDSTALNSLTPWQMKFGTDRVVPAGYVYNANKYYPLLYIKADNESIKAWYIDPGTQKPVATEAWGTGGKITDEVKEV